MHVDQITREIIGAALRVHTALGPGLLESAYRTCLVHELLLRGLQVETEVPVSIRYRGVEIRTAYRIDLLVERTVVVELKVVAAILPVHEAQTLSYLRLSNKPVALLINFYAGRLRDGIRRLVNGPVDTAES